MVLLVWLTTPDIRKPGRNSVCWLLPSLVPAVAWMGGFCYVLTWMCLTIARILAIPENVVGLVWLAFGCSVPGEYCSRFSVLPDSLSSLLLFVLLSFLASLPSFLFPLSDTLQSLSAAMHGEGDNAVSSSLGSNVLNMGLIIPIVWLFSTGIIFPNSNYLIQSTVLGLFPE